MSRLIVPNNTYLKGKKRLFLFFLILISLAFILRVLVYFAFGPLTMDSPDYILVAKRMLYDHRTDLENVFFVGKTTMSPLYPFFIMLFSFVFRDFTIAGVAVSVFFSLALIILVYFFAKELFGRTVAFLASILTSFYPALVYLSTNVMTESLYIFLFLIIIFIGWLAIKNNRKMLFFFLGLLIGLSYLTRTQGFANFFVMSSLIVLFMWKNKTFVLRNILFLFIGFLILSMPYILSLHQIFGTWTLTPLLSGGNIINTDIDRYNVLEREQASGLKSENGELILFSKYKTAPSLVSAFINLNLLRRLRFTFETFLPSLIPPIVLLFVFFALFGRTYDFFELKKHVYLICWVSSLIAFYIAFNALERYFVPILPIVMIWCAKGIVDFNRWLNCMFQNIKKKVQIKKVIVFSFLVCLIFLSFLPKFYWPLDYYIKEEGPLEHKEAGLWLKENLGPNRSIIARNRDVGFYADWDNYFLPYANYSDVIKYMQQLNISYIVIDEMYTASLRPPIAFLINETNAPKELKVIYNQNRKLGHKILIYKLNSSTQYLRK